MKIFLFLLFFFLLACLPVASDFEKKNTVQNNSSPQKTFSKKNSQDTVKIFPKEKLIYPWQENFEIGKTIAHQISPPPGFRRIKTTESSFQKWLQFLPLFPEEKKVHLHDGNLKANQNAHFRVVNIDVGKRDLQQCADAVMRLRAEYLFGKNEFEKIHFNYTNGTKVAFEDWRKGKRPVVNGNRVSFSNSGQKDGSYSNFKKYLIQVFNYAGTASLEKEMQSVDLMDMQIGDVLIQGGFPGHAVIVVDMVENEAGQKLFMIAQSYMPAQNIHILKNYTHEKWSPWFELIDNQLIRTPEWTFKSSDLKRFR